LITISNKVIDLDDGGHRRPEAPSFPALMSQAVGAVPLQTIEIVAHRVVGIIVRVFDHCIAGRFAREPNKAVPPQVLLHGGNVGVCDRVRREVCTGLEERRSMTGRRCISS
jgi:hypothetical protein